MRRKAPRWLQILIALFVVASLQVAAEATTLEVVPSASEAQYRVREQLAGYNFPNDAVGTTQSISGTITFDAQGRLGPGSKLTVDLRTLRSDEAKRDNYLRAKIAPRLRTIPPNPLMPPRRSDTRPPCLTTDSRLSQASPVAAPCRPSPSPLAAAVSGSGA